METREFVIRVSEEGVKCGVIRLDDRVEFVYHKSQNDWLEHIHAYAKKVATLPVFIHGLWGDKPKIYRKMVNKVSADIFPEYPLVLHIVWEGKNTYRNNHDLIDTDYAPKVSKLMIMVDKMLNRPNINILAHSMGSRMMVQVFKNVMKGRNESQKYNLVLAAGDLPVDICNEFIDQYIRDIDQIHLLYNPKDITLKLANFRKKYKRTGLEGCKKSKFNVHNHLIAKQKDEEIFLSSIFGHRYFYSSPKIRTLIKDLFYDAVEGEIFRRDEIGGLKIHIDELE